MPAARAAHRLKVRQLIENQEIRHPFMAGHAEDGKQDFVQKQVGEYLDVFVAQHTGPFQVDDQDCAFADDATHVEDALGIDTTERGTNDRVLQDAVESILGRSD